MAEDIKKAQESKTGNEESKNEPLQVHNPFEGGEDKQITQEQIDNEQKFKEALSERN